MKITTVKKDNMFGVRKYSDHNVEQLEQILDEAHKAHSTDNKVIRVEVSGKREYETLAWRLSSYVRYHKLPFVIRSKAKNKRLMIGVEFVSKP